MESKHSIIIGTENKNNLVRQVDIYTVQVWLSRLCAHLHFSSLTIMRKNKRGSLKFIYKLSKDVNYIIDTDAGGTATAPSMRLFYL
mmetsp:Transcript_17269/g.25899  ORF Transcript_17269/g.25899 Transcript_17269/m.25899 type:complete len:86 (+) Transcript_17269:112-369(+)